MFVYILDYVNSRICYLEDDRIQLDESGNLGWKILAEYGFNQTECNVLVSKEPIYFEKMYKDGHYKAMPYDDKPEIIENNDQTKRVKEVFDECLALFKSKNNDYDSSFEDGLDIFGISSPLSRIYDKVRRLISLLIKGNKKMVDESPIETFKDLLIYSAMTLAYYKKKENKNDSKS
jgi:hypothetical protein